MKLFESTLVLLSKVVFAATVAAEAWLFWNGQPMKALITMGFGGFLATLLMFTAFFSRVTRVLPDEEPAKTDHWGPVQADSIEVDGDHVTYTFDNCMLDTDSRLRDQPRRISFVVAQEHVQTFSSIKVLNHHKRHTVLSHQHMFYADLVFDNQHVIKSA
jgi:hypothetical protein